VQQKEWLTAEDISEMLGVPVDSVRQWIRDKRLKATKPGRQWLVRQKDLDEFLKDNSNISDDQ
jgi:excisionase family DNA binding protein